MSDDAQDLIAQLTKLGYRVLPPGAKRKPRSCTVCGAIEEAAFFSPDKYDTSGFEVQLIAPNLYAAEWLTKIRVEVGEQGEEGWDFKEMLLCPEDETGIINKLIEIGFSTHHHGGTHPLADDSCPGAHDARLCPRGYDDGEGAGYYTFSSPYDEETL